MEETMKSNVFFIAVLIVMILAGCTQENDFGSSNLVSGNYTLNAIIENDDRTLTRTTVNENGQVLWTENDCIGVFGNKGTKNASFALAKGFGEMSGSFKGNLSVDEEAETAYYPYAEDAALNGNTLTFTLPTEYTYTGNSNAPMLGVKNENGDFQFKHLAGLLCITINNLPESAERFVITSSGSDNAPYLAGDAVISNISDENPVMEVSDGSKSITYALGDMVTDSGFRTFFVPMPVGTYPQISVALYTKDEETPLFTRTITNLVVKRATMLSMPILDAQSGAQYVLGENTVEISAEMSEHISVSPTDNTTLIFSKEVSGEDIPEIGQIILARASENLPDGFLGKVASVKDNGDGTYIVETTIASLSETFDELYVDEMMTLVPMEQTLTREGKSYAFDIELSTGYTCKYAEPGQPLFAEGSVEFGSTFYFSIALDKKEKIELSSVSVVNAFSLKGTVGARGTFPQEEEDGIKKIPLGELSFAPLPLAGGLIRITPVIGSNFLLKFKGTIENTISYNTTIKTFSGSEYRNGEWVGGSSEREQGINNKVPFKFEYGWKGALTFKGEMFVGFSFPLEARLYNRKDMSIGIAPEAGFCAEAQIKIDESNSQSLGDILSDAKVKTWFDLNAKFEADASLFGLENLKYEQTIFEAKLLQREFPLFPDFPKPEATVTPEEATEVLPEPTYEADVETEIEGPTILEDVEVAYALENEETGEIEEISEPIPYSGDVEAELLGDEEPIVESKPIKATFKQLKPKVSYIVYPVIVSPLLQSITGEENVPMEQKSVDINIGKSEREILVEFYKSTGGDNWINKENWCSDRPLFTWHGIATNEEGEVIGISLRDNNLIGEANLTGLKKMEYLYVENNVLTGLNVAKADTLNTLYCSNNALKTLNVSGATDLQSIICSSNQLTDLNVSGLGKLEQLYCDENKLTGLDVSGLSNLKDFCCNANSLTNLNLAGCDNLEILACGGVDAYLPNLDVSVFTKLKDLYVAECGLTELNVSTLRDLVSLVCSYNQLTNLNVSNLRNLEILGCGNNPLMDLNVSNLINLTELECNNSQLTDLDLSNLKNLKRLHCTENQLSSLDVSGLELLEILYCQDNQLLSLNLSTSIVDLNCSNNQLSDLDVSQLPMLESLSCENNLLTNLDAANLKKLKRLYCSENQLKSLAVDELIQMTYLSCSDNQITTLNVTKLKDLERLYCQNNQLASLDVSGLEKLILLWCYGNPLISIDISGLTSMTSRDWFKCSEPLITVYLSAFQESMKPLFPVWGEKDSSKYPEPNHRDGYQYPEFIYK